MAKQHIEMTLVSRCPVGCSYCPQDKLPKLGKMTLETHATVLTKIPRGIEVHYSGMAEPMYHPNLVSMIQAARGSGHPVHLYTTMMGLRGHDLFGPAPVDKLVIHTSPFLHKNGHSLAKLERAVMRTLELFPCENWSTVRPGVDGDKLIDWAGNLPDVPAEHPNYSGRRKCGLAGKHFRRVVVMPDGKVRLCCMDYSGQHILGDLVSGSWEDLDTPKNPALCATCEYSMPEWMPDWTGRPLMKLKGAG